MWSSSGEICGFAGTERFLKDRNVPQAVPLGAWA